MAVVIQNAAVVRQSRSRTTARSTRKVGIFGAHQPSLIDAPWDDDSWEFWGHASARLWYSRSMDRYYDLHPKSCWTRGGKKGATYPQWLAIQTTPIYMQKRYPDVPASMEFPVRRILQEFGNPRPYFTNHVAWMIAHALTEGVTTIGLWGINYALQSEYVAQRASAEYWIGRAVERGVKVILPEQCSLLRDPKLLYGYESHDEETGVLKDEYAKKAFPPTPESKPGSIPAVPTPEIKAEMEREEIEFPRPPGCILPNRTDGEALRSNA
jgi:hypothetical protein